MRKPQLDARPNLRQVPCTVTSVSAKSRNGHGSRSPDRGVRRTSQRLSPQTALLSCAHVGHRLGPQSIAWCVQCFTMYDRLHWDMGRFANGICTRTCDGTASGAAAMGGVDRGAGGYARRGEMGKIGVVSISLKIFLLKWVQILINFLKKLSLKLKCLN